MLRERQDDIIIESLAPPNKTCFIVKNIYQKVSFYIVPHADDWQLFMQPHAYNDLISSETKVVFIITTAGDAGKEKNYWSAREEGAKSSVRFCLAPLKNLCESSGVQSFLSHLINYWLCNNATCYFMRLPDGGLQGDGFDRYNFQSLTKCNNEQGKSIMAIDGSVTYNNCKDISDTLESIIVAESAGISNGSINYLNPDIKINPGDHADHIATGLLVQAMNKISTIYQQLFTGYDVRNNAERLPEDEYFWKAAIFAAYEKAVFDASGYSTLKENPELYLEWCRAAAKFSMEAV